MKKKEFLEFLKKQNPKAHLTYKVRDNKKNIELPIHSVFSEYEEYFELYHKKDEEFAKPITIGELTNSIEFYQPFILVYMLEGNEDGDDKSYEVEITDLIVKQPRYYEDKKFIVHCNDMEPEIMDWQRIKEYAHNVFCAYSEDEVFKELNLSSDDVTSEAMTMETVIRIFAFMEEDFEEINDSTEKKQTSSKKYLKR